MTLIKLMKKLEYSGTALAFFTIFIALLTTNSINAQVHPCEELSIEERREMAVEWIDRLEENGLIISLVSNRRQLDHLRSLLAQPGNQSERNIARSQKKYEELKEKTEETAKNAIAAFAKNYDFSPVYFIWDYDIPTLWQRPDSNIFVNSELEFYAEPQFYGKAEKLFVLYRGRVEAARGSGIEAWIVRNHQYNYLCRPFPYFVGRNNNWFINALLSVFHPDLYQERDLMRVAEMFQERFESFKNSRIYMESVSVD